MPVGLTGKTLASPHVSLHRLLLIFTQHTYMAATGLSTTKQSVNVVNEVQKLILTFLCKTFLITID
jgi:hypothetical protein